jgi:hypothetical protein
MSVFSAIKKFCVQFMFEKTSSFALCMLVRLLALITAQFTVERESLSVDCRFIVEFSGFRIAVSKGPGLFSTSPDKEISKAAGRKIFWDHFKAWLPSTELYMLICAMDH